MAEALSPPLFREPLVYRNTLEMTPSWQRWLSFLVQQAGSSTPGPQGPAGPVGPTGPTGATGPPGPAIGAGVANKVGYWLNASTMTYDSLLHYDPVQHWLGIGTTTVTAPLTFTATIEQKIHLFSSGTTRYGLGISSGALDIFAQTGGGVVRLGHMSIADGTTFTSAMGVTQTAVDCAVPMSVAWPAQANYELTTNRFYAAGVSRFNSNLVVAGILDAYSYSMIQQLRIGDHVAPGYGLDVNAQSMFRGLVGIGYPPDAGYWLRCAGAKFDLIDVVGGLTVGGACTISGNLGTSGYAPGTTYGIETHSVHCSAASRFESNVVVAGYLHMSGNVLYTAGAEGITAQGYAEGGTFGVARWLVGNPVWGDCRAELVHVYGSVVYLNVAATGVNHFQFHLSGANAFILAGAWVDAASDRRIKRDIQPIDTPLERLAKLHGSHYERTDLVAAEGFPAPNPYEYGLIAQDVAEALPDAAFEHDYGEERGKLWNYYDRPILALLVESVKALAQRVEALEAV